VACPQAEARFAALAGIKEVVICQLSYRTLFHCDELVIQ
jgi:hypothetical protein